MFKKPIAAACLLLLFSPVPAVLAQAVNVPVNTDQSAQSDQGESERVTVTDVPIEENIMPTSRPTDSVYGTDTPILDTPRNATIISTEQLSAIDIQDPRDFSKLTSDSYTQSNFGAPANPSIRGQTADVFINGMRRGLTSNGNGFPLDFNSVESVDIIKGPADAVYGSSQYVGGYTDEITKAPFFDKWQGSISTTDGMYQVYRWALDTGGPLIKNELAMRLSYSGQDSGSYYDNSHIQQESVYGAITWTPNSKYTLAFNSEFEDADYNENNGINRVTQNLIDNNQYITGTVPGGPAAIGEFFNPVVAGPTVYISPAQHIIGVGDGSNGHTEDAQVIQTLVVNDGFKIIDNALYERIDRRTYNSQQFDEVLKDNAAFDNRLELIFDNDFHVAGETKSDVSKGKDAKDGKDAKEVASQVKSDTASPWVLHNELNTGLEFRFQTNTNYDTFAYEPFDAFDITQPISTVNIPLSSNLAAGQYHVPGEPAKFVFTPNNGDSAQSVYYEFGPYFQDEFKLTNQLSLFFGGRADILYVDSTSPPGTPAALYEATSTKQVLPNANISPTYKPFSWMTLYFTYNFSESTNTGDGGSYSPTFTPEDYHQQSRLYELGSKFSLLKDKLFLTVTGYQQERANPSIGGTSVIEDVKGVEFEADYQPNKHFYATASYSILDSESINPGFTHEATPIATGPVAPGTVLITDSASFVLPSTPAGDAYLGTFRTPGYPKSLINGLVSYKTDFGLGATADIQITSPMTVSYDETVKIPWQYNIDFSVFYQYKNLIGRVSVYNATNQYNWNPANPIYGNESIFALEPIHVEGTFKILF
jgi:outer membrane receptor protein involved in Fe transport